MSDFEALINLKATKVLIDRKSWTIEVSCEGESQTGTVTNPFEEVEESGLKWYFEEYPEKDPYATGKAAIIENAIKSYGKSLLEELRPLFDACGLDSSSTSCVLQVSGLDEDDSIQCLHWETLEHPSLGLNLSVYRGVSGPYRPVKHPHDSSTSKASDFNILFITSRLIEEYQVDTDHRPVLKSFIDIFARASGLARFSGRRLHFDVVRPGTLEALREHVRLKHYDMVHFDVHGSTSNYEDAEAKLIFASDFDLSRPQDASAKEIGELLVAKGVETVVLNACNSAAANSSTEANLAAGLIKAGISAVVGMSYDIGVSAAELFVLHFYEAFLLQREDIACATLRARQALLQEKSRVARFQHRIKLDDWIVPVLYQRIDASASYFPLRPLTRVSTFPSTPGASSASIASIFGPIPMEEKSPLIGRDFDIFRLESFLAKYKAVEIKGEIGVGKTAFVESAIKWWKSTKFVNREVVCDIWREKIYNAEDLGKWIAQKLLLEADALPQDGKKPQDYWTELQLALDVIAKQSRNQILLVIDHFDDLFKIADDRSHVAELNKLLKRLCPDNKRAQRAGVSTNGRLISGHYLIITSSRNLDGLTKLQPMVLRPLQMDDALELAVEVSPKLKAVLNVRNDDRRILVRFIQSLRGNPLSITLLMKEFNDSHTSSLQRFISSAWSFSPKGHAQLRQALATTHFFSHCRVLTELESNSFGILSTFVAFREYVPKTWAEFLSGPEAFEMKILKKMLSSTSLKSHEEDNHDGSQGDETEGDDDNDDVRTLLQQQSLTANAENAMEVCRASGLAFESQSPHHWEFHPLVPYVLEMFSEQDTAKENQSLRESLFAYYDLRSSTWLRPLPDTTAGLELEVEYDASEVAESFPLEVINYINVTRFSLEDMKGWHFKQFPGQIMLRMSLSIDNTLGKDLEDVAVVAKLFAEAVNLFIKHSFGWRTWVLATRQAAKIRRGTTAFLSVQHDEEQYTCECKPLILCIGLAEWLFFYQLRGGNAFSDAADRALLSLEQLVHLFTSTFTDDGHTKSSDATKTRVSAETSRGMLELSRSNFAEAIRAFSKCKEGLEREHIPSDHFIFLQVEYFLAEARLKDQVGMSGVDEESVNHARSIYEATRQSYLEAMTSESSKTNIAVLKKAVDLLDATAAWPMHPERLIGIHPELAATLSAGVTTLGVAPSERARAKDTASVVQGKRISILQNLEGFLELDSVRGQFLSHVQLQKACLRNGDFPDALVHSEKILSLMDEFGIDEAVKSFQMGTLYSDAGACAAGAGEEEKALNYLGKAYVMLQKNKHLRQQKLGLIFFYNSLSTLPLELLSESWGTRSLPSMNDYAVELLSLLYEPDLWDCQFGRNLILADRDAEHEIRPFYEANQQGRIFMAICMDDIFIFPDTGGIRFGGMDVIKAISDHIGCSAGKVKDFISQVVFPAAGLAADRDAAHYKTIGKENVGLYEMETVVRVFWEAERAVFAPEKMRTEFKHIDKKYEKKGLRTRWSEP